MGNLRGLFLYLEVGLGSAVVVGLGVVEGCIVFLEVGFGCLRCI